MAGVPFIPIPADAELERSEAYQHGRTIERLNAARLALEKIAFGRKCRNLTAARALAKLGLDMSKGGKSDAE